MTIYTWIADYSANDPDGDESMMQFDAADDDAAKSHVLGLGAGTLLEWGSPPRLVIAY